MLEEQLLLSSERFMSELFDRRTSGRSGLRMVNIENGEQLLQQSNNHCIIINSLSETNRFRNSEIIKTLKKNDKPGGHKVMITTVYSYCGARGASVKKAGAFRFVYIIITLLKSSESVQIKEVSLCIIYYIIVCNY